MLKNSTIKARLIVVLALLSALMALIGVEGMTSLSTSNAALKTVYDDRLIALGQLDRVIRAINRNQLTVAKAVGGDAAKLPEVVEAMAKNRAEGDKVWKEYSATYLTPRGSWYR